MSWNRSYRRQMSRYGIGEQRMKEEFEKGYRNAQNYAYRNAWTSMMLAICDRFPEYANPDMLHSIAIDTMEYSDGLRPPAELEELLLEKSGFDITEKPEESVHRYIPKGGSGNDDL